MASSKLALLAALTAFTMSVHAEAPYFNTDNSAQIKMSANGYVYVGCYADAGSARTFGTPVNQLPVTGGADAMTVEACVTSANDATEMRSFDFVGLEYSYQVC